MKIAIVIRPQPKCYLSRHRLMRLSARLGKNATVILINKSGISYPNYEEISDTLRVIKDNWKVERKLDAYDWIVFEEHTWSDRMVELFKKRRAVQFCSTPVSDIEVVPEYRYILNDHAITTGVDYETYDLVEAIPIKHKEGFARTRLLYPYKPESKDQLRPLNQARGVFPLYQLQFCMPTKSTVLVKRAFKQLMVGVEYRDVNPWTNEYLQRAKYCMIEHILPPGTLLDLLFSDITPILMDVTYPYHCVDEFNAIVIGKYSLHTLSSKIKKIDNIPFKDRKALVEEQCKEFDPKALIQWLVG